MPHAPSSTVDITTWQIRVRHDWEAETDDHWENPSEHPVMREVLHESVHFWQAVGLPYFLRITCAAYWDFQRVRAAAFGQDGDSPTSSNSKPTVSISDLMSRSPILTGG